MIQYRNKTLVVAGCSHTYGQYLEEWDPDQCHPRSWASKMGFANTVNLACPGGSNTRAIRLLTDYILESDNPEDLVVMLGLTELARTEFHTTTEYAQHFYTHPLSDSKLGKNSVIIGPWCSDTTTYNKARNFIREYYGNFYNDAAEQILLKTELLKLHYFLLYFKVEHYFPSILIQTEALDMLDMKKLPIINFDNTNAVSFLKENKFKTGKEVNSSVNCNHFNHDGNEFLANYLKKHIWNTI